VYFGTPFFICKFVTYSIYMSETIYSYQQLYQFSLSVFKKMGCSNEDATLATSVLLSADLRGIDSHGIARLVGYVRLWEVGRINPTPNIRVVYETPSTAVVDGDRGLGLVVAPRAMQIAIDKAKLVGSGWVSVKNSNHFGIAGYHAMMALSQDMIGMAMTNASALVAPTYAAEKLLGTNPIAVAVPAGKEAPFVADFATTTAANGKLEIAQRKNEPIPEGWAQDAAGNNSTDAAILKKGGALLPLGSEKEQGSHKGYALGSIVDIFSGVLSGASFGPWAPPFPAYVPMPENMPGEGLGHFLGAMRIDGFRPAIDFKNNMDLWLNRFRNATPIEGQKQVYVAGDIERSIEAERMKNGIPLVAEVVADLTALGAKLNLHL
jgi:LDH2 family malate/lactate/ureidoglycolate dehydrogenase